MRPNAFALLLGLSLLSHGINLFILVAGRITLHRPPVLPTSGAIVPSDYADPLPQAFILTAIVISFAVTAFAAVLVYRLHETAQTESPDLTDPRDAAKERLA
jgi:multisubunit Na+/H+ antiporter MnhC subunit